MRLLLLLSLVGLSGFAAAPHWTVHEISLRSARACQNPYREAAVNGEFRSPDGAVIKVPICKIRFTPAKIGRWTYVTHPADPGLDNQKGVVDYGAQVTSDTPMRQNWVVY